MGTNNMLLHNVLGHGWYAVWLSAAMAFRARAAPSLTLALKETGLSTEAISMIYNWLLPMLVYYVFGAFLAVIDLLYADSCASRRLQPGSKVPSTRDYLDALKLGTLNWFLVGLPYTAALVRYVLPWRASLGGPSLPFLGQIAVCVVAVECIFYASHRLLHTRLLYARVHKLHHTFTAPFGYAAIYAHPLEHLLSNVLAVSAGPVLAGMDDAASCAWAALSLVNTMVSHSGWALPGFHDPSAHDWHHAVFDENYGVIGLCDTLAGSNARYAAAVKAGLFERPQVRAGPGAEEGGQEGAPAAAARAEVWRTAPSSYLQAKDKEGGQGGKLKPRRE